MSPSPGPRDKQWRPAPSATARLTGRCLPQNTPFCAMRCSHPRRIVPVPHRGNQPRIDVRRMLDCIQGTESCPERTRAKGLFIVEPATCCTRASSTTTSTILPRRDDGGAAGPSVVAPSTGRSTVCRIWSRSTISGAAPGERELQAGGGARRCFEQQPVIPGVQRCLQLLLPGDIGRD